MAAVDGVKATEDGWLKTSKTGLSNYMDTAV